MEDKIDIEELSEQNKTPYDAVPLRLGIAALVSLPLSYFFFQDGVALFGYAFFFGALIFAIIGLGLIRQYKNENLVLSPQQLQKFKVAKILLVVALVVNLSLLLLFCLLVISKN